MAASVEQMLQMQGLANHLVGLIGPLLQAHQQQQTQGAQSLHTRHKLLSYLLLIGDKMPKRMHDTRTPMSKRPGLRAKNTKAGGRDTAQLDKGTCYTGVQASSHGRPIAHIGCQGKRGTPLHAREQALMSLRSPDIRLTLTIDSGATERAVSENPASQFATTASGSNSAVIFVATNGASMPSRAEKTVDVRTPDGHYSRLRMHVAVVQKPLTYVFAHV